MAVIRRLRGVGRRVPLSVTLVVALITLVTLALIATGAAAATALRGRLLDRVDQDLNSVSATWMGRIVHQTPRPRTDDGPFSAGSRFYVVLLDRRGTAVALLETPNAAGDGAPVLNGLTVSDVRRKGGAPFEVSDRDDGPRWRAVVAVLPDGSGSIATARSLDDVDGTVSQLVVIETSVGIVVLLLLGSLGYLMVRTSLRPLAHVEATAAAIAAGDLSRRVPERDPRTEVGRLARAFNAMLGHIEAAFSAREQSEAAARASEERMRRFVADASHELRTPLTSIRGFAELYRQGAVREPADVARVMGRVEAEAQRMGVLVDDLLLLARLDQQRPLERTPVDLAALAADAVHDARAVAPDRPISLRVHPADRPPVVLGDEARLRQVVANLVSNAIMHTPAATQVEVTVSVLPAAVEVQVRDSGPGMPAEDAARVFERFYRADPSRTRAHGGTGLGLSIVAALVAAHGGTVDVDTAPGEGASFRVRLPLLSGAAPPADGSDTMTQRGALSDAVAHRVGTGEGAQSPNVTAT
jgi:two-component system OmpR family sensor kinase